MALRSEVILLVAYDVGQVVDLFLTDRDNGNPIDLTGVTTAKLAFRAAGTTTVLHDQALTIVSTTGGQLRLTTPAGFLDHPAGRYEGEVRLSDGVNDKTVYDLVQFRLRDPVI